MDILTSICFGLILNMKEQYLSWSPGQPLGTAEENPGDRKIMPNGRKKGTYGQHQ